MWFVFLQGFAGVFPWNVITFFFFAYLEKERGYDANSILFTMAPVILILASGYFVGGALGDFAFKRTNKGRIIVSSVGVLLGAIFMYLAITTPIEAKNQFFILMCLTALFMPLSSANVIATVYDVTVPEVRSTAQAVGILHRKRRRGLCADPHRRHRRCYTIYKPPSCSSAPWHGGCASSSISARSSPLTKTRTTSAIKWQNARKPCSHAGTDRTPPYKDHSNMPKSFRSAWRMKPCNAKWKTSGSIFTRRTGSISGKLIKKFRRRRYSAA